MTPKPLMGGSRCVHNVPGGCISCRQTVEQIKAVAKVATDKAKQEGFTVKRAA